MPQTPEQVAIVAELYRRRDSLDPEKRAVVDELAKRYSIATPATKQSRGASGSWDDRPGMSPGRLAVDTADALRMRTVEKTADLLKGTATTVPEYFNPLQTPAVINAGAGVPGAIGQALTAVKNAGAVIPEALRHYFEESPSATPEQAQDRMVEGTTDFVTEVAPLIYGAGQAARAGLRAARTAIPSRVRAGAKFDQVLNAAKDVPINTAEAEAALARAQELRTRGSTMPKVLTDFAKNRKAATGDFMGQPVTEPMTYAAGRDFASNAGAMSKREITAMNAKMQSQIAKFGEAMKTANREAAVKVGMGDVYDAAMKEYAIASSIAAKRQVLTKHLVKWGGAYALGTGFAAGLVKVFSNLTD